MKQHVKTNSIRMQSCQHTDCNGDEREKESKHMRRQDAWRAVCMLIALIGAYSGVVLLWRLQDSWFWMPQTDGIYSFTYRMAWSRLIALRVMAAALAWILIVGSLLAGCYFGLAFRRRE